MRCGGDSGLGSGSAAGDARPESRLTLGQRGASNKFRGGLLKKKKNNEEGFGFPRFWGFFDLLEVYEAFGGWVGGFFGFFSNAVHPRPMARAGRCGGAGLGTGRAWCRGGRECRAGNAEPGMPRRLRAALPPCPRAPCGGSPAGRVYGPPGRGRGRRKALGCSSSDCRAHPAQRGKSELNSGCVRCGAGVRGERVVFGQALRVLTLNCDQNCHSSPGERSRRT